MRPLRYPPRKTNAEKKQAKRAAQRKWATQNRETLLRQKREYARRPENLARRRARYRLRNESKPPPPPKPMTLDDFARSLLPEKMPSTMSDAANGTPSVHFLERAQGLQPACDSNQLLQRLPQIVEFRYECLDAKGRPIAAPEHCGSVPYPEVTGVEQELEQTRNSCDATDCTLTE